MVFPSEIPAVWLLNPGYYALFRQLYEYWKTVAFFCTMSIFTSIVLNQTDHSPAFLFCFICWRSWNDLTCHVSWSPPSCYSFFLLNVTASQAWLYIVGWKMFEVNRLPEKAAKVWSQYPFGAFTREDVLTCHTVTIPRLSAKPTNWDRGGEGSCPGWWGTVEKEQLGKGLCAFQVLEFAGYPSLRMSRQAVLEFDSITWFKLKADWIVRDERFTFCVWIVSPLAKIVSYILCLIILHLWRDESHF